MTLPPRNGDTTDDACLEVLEIIMRLLTEWCFDPEPIIVVEAGTNTGHSAQVMGKFAMVNSADPVDRGAGGDLRFRYYNTTFEEMLESVRGWHVAYLDASGPNHDNRLRWEHFQLCRKLNPNGIIIVHDTAVEGWAGPHTNNENVLPLIKDACQYNLPIGKGLSIFIP